jgi:tetratricopeptide (TPR) repeat protein
MLGVDLRKLSEKKLIFLLCLVVFLVYFNSLFNEFNWDDEGQIVNNEIIQNISNLPLLFKGSTFGTGGAGLTGWYYKPLLSLSFMINFWLWGGSPFGFHLLQIVFHIANVALVFLILKKLFRNLKFKIRNGNQGLAFLVALVWGVHPANVEAVAYISATQEVLFSFFCLLAFWVVLKRVRGSLFIAGILFFLALLAKEAALVGGALILLYLFLFERERFLLGLGVFSLSLTGYVWLRIGVAGIPFSSHGIIIIIPIAQASLKERLLTVPLEFFSYLRLIFWPQVLAICQHFVVRKVDFNKFWWPLAVDLSFLGCLSYSGWRLKSKVFWFFAFWFLGGILMVLNIFPLDMTAAERWLYFPMIGFLGGLSLVIVEILEKEKSLRKVLGWVVLVVLICLGVRTVKRNFDWRNGLTLFSHDIKYSKDAFDLEGNLGVVLLRLGRLEEAKVHFERSVELEPKHWMNYNNLGVIYMIKGDSKRAEELYWKALGNGSDYLIYENLALILLSQKRWWEAEMILEEAVGKFPGNEWFRRDLEVVREKLK